jgi:hypothetical protein
VARLAALYSTPTSGKRDSPKHSAKDRKPLGSTTQGGNDGLTNSAFSRKFACRRRNFEKGPSLGVYQR